MIGRIAVSLSQAANARGLYLGPRSARIHVALYRLSHGRIGAHLPGLPQAQVLLLNHTGAKTGVRRTSPLMFHRDDDRFAVVASKAGQPTNPAWYHNLIANPDTTIQVGGDVHEVRARVADDTERAALWPKLLTVYPGYEFFERLATRRKIPVVVLERRTTSGAAGPKAAYFGRLMPNAPRPIPYVDPEAPRGAVSRTMIRLLGMRPILWFERTSIWRVLWWRLVPRLWRLTGGRLGGNAPLPTGLLETRDARNGRTHRRVLFYFHDEDKITLIATKGGLSNDPYWYVNALASPEVRFSREPFRAEPVDTEAERDRLWALADRYFPPFAAYRALAARAGREIPVLQLTPG